MSDVEGLAEDERAMLHPCYSHLHEAVERIVAAHVQAARAEERAKVAQVLDALDRTESNFRLAVQGKPVRDMAETLAENAAARADDAGGEGL